MGRPRWRRLTIMTLKWAVTLVVLWAVGRHIVRTWNDLAGQSRPITFAWGWLVAGGLLYLAGLVACGCFFQAILRASPTPVALLPAMRAYLVSHLGKYVPGKAMVVVVRAGMVVPHGARGSTAAIATVYETVVMMASGGLIAAAGFTRSVGPNIAEFALPFLGLVKPPIYRVALWCSLGLGLAFLVLAIPQVFGKIAGLLSLPIPGMGPDALPRFTARLLIQGLLYSAAGWILLGLSQIAVIRAFDASAGDRLLTSGDGPVVIASVALATVAGFAVAVLPGGLGVREGVLMSALAPLIGSDAAVVASLSLRLVWVAAELAAAAVVSPWNRRPSAQVMAS
jgi:uncharacterized membrane protein YbhN (UPF0104 family)